MSLFDGNAILPNGTEVTVQHDASGYYIEDTISANHCLVIYSTMEPAKQIALADKSREISYSLASQKTTGVEIKVDTNACVGITDGTEFAFDVFRGVVDSYAENEDGYPTNYFETDALKKAYLKTDCSEYKESAENGTTLNKRAGTVTQLDNTTAKYVCDTNAKVGDTIAVRVKIKNDTSLLSSVNNGKNKLQVYDTDVYAVAIIKIVA